MAPSEIYYAVLLHGRRIGTLSQRGDHTRFLFNENYLGDAARPVLGLRFEENLRGSYAASLRLPKWFSNLLPEGPLRRWIAEDRGVSLDREMELLAQVGHDLPGAIQVMAADGPDESWEWPSSDVETLNGISSDRSDATSPWRFSLAGVALKFSMLEQGDRLTVPAVGERGDWLVKFPDYRFADVPRNEFVMMSMAGLLGIDVPDVRLIHRDELVGLPARMWPNTEQWAYAVRRFDRLPDELRTPVHIEDFAQVRDKYPQEKYEGTFETVAALTYRGHDVAALRDFARRLAFSVIVGNGDAHLKNWSLIYHNQRVPTLSPAYDLVSTVVYREQGDGPEDLGLKFGGSKRFDVVRLAMFSRLEQRLDGTFGATGAGLADIVVDVLDRAQDAWLESREALTDNAPLLKRIDEWIQASVPRLQATR